MTEVIEKKCVECFDHSQSLPCQECCQTCHQNYEKRGTTVPESDRNPYTESCCIKHRRPCIGCQYCKPDYTKGDLVKLRVKYYGHSKLVKWRCPPETPLYVVHRVLCKCVGEKVALFADKKCVMGGTVSEKLVGKDLVMFGREYTMEMLKESYKDQPPSPESNDGKCQRFS